jgi:hypothetical protein
MNKAKLKTLVICIFFLLFQGCISSGLSNNPLVSLASIPFQIVGAAIGAAIGAAAGLGVMPF